MTKKTFLIIIIIFILTIFLKGYFFSTKYKEDKCINDAVIYIESVKKLTDTSVSYNVKLGEAVYIKGKQTYSFEDKFILKIYNNENKIEDKEWAKYISYTNGDVIKITGKITIPEYMNNPGEFNYKYYLYSNNIYGEIIAYEIEEELEYNLNIKEKLLNYIYRYKEYLGKNIDETMQEKYSAVAKSILYGETLDIDETVKEDFEKAGVSHMMAISGANIIGLVSLITFIFKIIKLDKNINKIICILIIISFVILTGNSLSTLRAGIMCIIGMLSSIINEKSGKKNNTLKNLIITICIILLYAPFSVYNTGFVLSVLATLGIVLLSPHYTDLKERILEKVKNKFLKKILEVLLTNLFLTCSVQILILPVQINSFNLISLTSILSNIFCSLISGVITTLGSIYILTSYIPLVSNVVIYLIQICIAILLFLINIFKSLALEIKAMDLSIFGILIYYTYIFSVWLKIYLKRVFKDRRKTNFKRYTIVQNIILVMLVLIIAFSNIYFKHIESFVCFFNVGQGELSLIKNKDNMLIVDIGSLKTTLAYNSINNYFKMKNITRVDAVILSHMHSDHINGLESFVKEYEVGQIIYAKPFKVTDEYINFLNLVDKYNLKTKVVNTGDILEFGNIKVEVILPDKEEIIDKDDKDNINANSLVFKVSIEDKDILYMGDATEETENKLLKMYLDKGGVLKSVEILKVGHHGSKTSTSEEYIEKIKPIYAIISAKKKYYNHPHESVLETLNKYNVQVYITENIGCIKFNLYNL